MATPEHRMASNPRYNHLLKGSRLEVTSKAEGFVGSWFEATVIKPPEIPNSKFQSKRMTIIEYSDFLNEDASILLRENVDCVMLRPLPPKTKEDGGFEVGDVVDSFARDRWWTGKVDRVFKGEGEEVRYVVSFDEPKHEIEFGKDSLRLHLDWNGKWFRFWNGKPQELAVNKDGCVTLAMDGIHNKHKGYVILNPAPMGSVPEGYSEMMPSTNEQSTLLTGKSSPPLPLSCLRDTIHLELPNKKLKRTCVEEPFVHANNKPAELSNPLSKRQNRETDYHIMSTSHGKYHTSIRAKRSKTRARRYKNIDDVSKASDVHKVLSLEEQLTEVQSELILAKHGEAPESDAVIKSVELSNPLSDHQYKESGYDITRTSHGKYHTSIRAKRSKTRARRYKSIPDAVVLDDLSKAGDVKKDLSLKEQLREVVQSESALAKRGEAPTADTVIKSAELSNPLSDCQYKESGYHITSTSHGKYHTGVRAKRSKTRARRSMRIPDTLVIDGISKAGDVKKDLSLKEQLTEAVQLESALAKHGEALEADVVNNTTMQELARVAVRTELNHKEQDEVPKAVATNNLHMQELTLVAVGTELTPKEQGHSNLVIDEKMTAVSKGTMVVLNEGHQPATNNVYVIRPPLPFIRTLSVWEAVESLEIFRKFPQQPHFLPLMDATERFREGLAIGKMLTFASTAEIAITLSIDDTVNSFTDCLEALQTLETYGFNAETLQNRLMKLISLKEIQQKVDAESNELKGQVSELKQEFVRFEEEICETVNKIKLYQDKLKSELVKKEKKGLEILAVETTLDVLKTVSCGACEDSKDTC